MVSTDSYKGDIPALLTSTSHRPNCVVDRFVQTVAVVPVAGVIRHGQGATTERFDLAGDLLATIELAAGDHHVGPVRGERQHHLPAEAT